MARTARIRVEESPVEQRRFKAGLYARLSVEGDDRKNESIDTQIEIGKQFVERHPEISIYDVYTDLGATGTNFEREGFQRMLQDVKRRNIDCVIVKDLSRLGRDCVETGNYIQKIFPFMNVRFIAVADEIDTFDPTHSPDDITINLKNLVNEMYAKDISQKVRVTKRSQRNAGNFIGSIAPYGYVYTTVDNKRFLKIEPETAEIIRDIFNLRLEGYNLKQITEKLYERKIHTPTCRQKYGHIYQEEGEQLIQWNRLAIKWVLTNMAYIGHLVYGYTCGLKYKNRTLHDVDKEDVEFYYNTHEPIISEEMFYKVAESFKESAKYRNKKGFQKRVPVEEDIYQDVMVCGDCGKKLSRTTNIKTLGSGDKVRWYGYRCSDTNRIDYPCPAKGISKRNIDELVLAALEQEFKLSTIRPKIVTEECKRKGQQEISVIQQEIDKINATVLALNKHSSELYLQYRMGTITVSDYQSQKGQITVSLEENNKKLDSYKKEIWNIERKIEDKCKYLRQLMSCKKRRAELDRETINMLIQRIEVYSEHRVKIVFAFCMSDLLQKELRIHDEN